MKAYIEAISTIEYRPRAGIRVAEQIDLFQEAS